MLLGGMHEIFFGLKRVVHGTLRVGHELTREYGLTPARFDLLFELKSWTDVNSPSYPVSQRALRTLLGVSAPVVSRMLRSLEKLGLVWRGPRTSRYGTSRAVRLTVRGRALIRRASKRLVYSGHAHRIVRRALHHPWRNEPFNARFRALNEKLCTMRRFFGDVTLPPWPTAPTRAPVGAGSAG